MEISTESILSKLHEIFPSGVIYEDEYNAQRARISLPVDMAIRKLSKGQGLTRSQWLQKNGFTWKVSGYIEPVMRTVHGDFCRDDAFFLADSVFRTYPLAGQYIMSDAEEALLFRSAQQTVQKMTLSDDRVTVRESVVLTLETIELLKIWSSDLNDPTENGSFWNYIYLQYGFNPENSPAATDRLYNRFCKAIRSTLLRYNRFFAPEGTQRYYTSLMLHAMSPVQSVENLFRILFDFYAKNLDFQYVPEDTCYRVFSKNICAKWNEFAVPEQNVHLRSDSIFSGLQVLFLNCPGYMSSVCDSIVRKTDLLLRGELFEAADYWDKLLLDWYDKKSSSERVYMQSQQKNHAVEYVATTEDRIYMQYRLEHQQVGIEIPRIRLQQVGQSRPSVVVFQEDREIYRAELSVTGNTLCMTTQKTFIPLAKTALDFDADLSICAEITYMGNPLFQSGRKLYRKHLFFDMSGNERLVKKGDVSLFVPNSHCVEFSTYDGVSQDCLHPGQLYQISLDEVSSAAIDGIELFADREAASQFRSHASVKAVDGLCVVREGVSYHIFSVPFSLFLKLPEGEQALRYQLSEDGSRYPISHYKQADSDELRLTMNGAEGLAHSIKVIDLIDDTVKYEFDYILLLGCSYQLDKQLYAETEQNISVSISAPFIGAFSSSAVRDAASDTVHFSCPFADLEFEAVIPVVRCSIAGGSGFSLPEKIWCKTISAGEFIRLQLPPDWTGQLLIGLQPVSVSSVSGEFELGNHLRAGKNFSDEEMLWLSLKSQHGDAARFLLTTLVFAPHFAAPPLIFSGCALMWQVESNFIGDTDSEFTIEVQGADGHAVRFRAACRDQILDDECHLPHGGYRYRIFLRRRSPFSSEESRPVYQGTLIVGNRNEFMFDGKELSLTIAHYWDRNCDSMKRLCMKPLSGITRNLTYIGNTVASGETIAAPEYRATLYYTDDFGRGYVFYNKDDSQKYECINPVRIWIVSERMLILRCCSGDAVYIDAQTATIPSRHPDVLMDKKAQMLRLKNPDYFEYTQEEVNRHV